MMIGRSIMDSEIKTIGILGIEIVKTTEEGTTTILIREMIGKDEILETVGTGPEREGGAEKEAGTMTGTDLRVTEIGVAVTHIAIQRRMISTRVEIIGLQMTKKINQALIKS